RTARSHSPAHPRPSGRALCHEGAPRGGLLPARRRRSVSPTRGRAPAAPLVSIVVTLGLTRSHFHEKARGWLMRAAPRRERSMQRTGPPPSTYFSSPEFSGTPVSSGSAGV